jgi:autotransporter-associated beta strand protein
MNRQKSSLHGARLAKLQACAIALVILSGGLRELAAESSHGGLRELAAESYQIDFVTGPVSTVYQPDAAGDPDNSGWFPDAHFPLTWGGANDPAVNLSFWSPRRSGTSMDDTIATPGAGWMVSGPYGSGDYRGYWLSTVIRPSDYDPSLLGTTVDLTIYTTNNASNSVVPHVIDNNYLECFCHVEDYNTQGQVVNNTRTIYSFDNGITWNKGPWDTAVLVAVDSRTNPGTPRLVTLHPGSLSSTTNLANGDGWTSTPATFNPGGNFGYCNSLFYNRYLGMWMVWYYNFQGGAQSTVYSAVSSDLINWVSGTGHLNLDSTLPASSKAAGNYPTMLGSLAPGATFGNYDMQSGQLLWLYNNIGGLGGRAVHLVKVLRQDITWKGGGGSLSTSGNWTPTAGGSFTGFADEAQSLTFAGGNGSLKNDLPTTTRVRGLVFAAGTGSYDLSGNNLELEAYTYGTGSSAALTSIANYSASAQTIDAGIDARSAALYLYGANGSLTINGNIEMWGNGGIDVYGAFPVTVNGAIGNSGYHDFTSGEAEFIANSNEGRLVMESTSTLTLGGTNTFGGRTDILGGVIQLTNAMALQNSVVTFTTDNALVLAGDAKLGGLNGTGNLALGPHNLTLGNDNPPTCYVARYSGVLSGSGSLTKTGGNTQRIGVTNTYTGGTALNGGTLEVPANVNTALGTGAVTFGGGTFKALGTMTLSNAVVVNSGGGTILCNGFTIKLTGPVSGTGPLNIYGPGSVNITGPITSSGSAVNKNTVQVGTSGPLDTGASTLSVTSYAEPLRISGSSTINLEGNPYTLNDLIGAAGVLLKGGTIGGGTLVFGTNPGGATGAMLSSAVRSSGGLSLFGTPGSVFNLSRGSSCPGGIIIDGATLTRTVSGPGHSSGPGTIDGLGKLEINFTTSTSR